MRNDMGWVSKHMRSSCRRVKVVWLCVELLVYWKAIEETAMLNSRINPWILSIQSLEAHQCCLLFLVSPVRHHYGWVSYLDFIRLWALHSNQPWSHAQTVPDVLAPLCLSHDHHIKVSLWFMLPFPIPELHSGPFLILVFFCWHRHIIGIT